METPVNYKTQAVFAHGTKRVYNPRKINKLVYKQKQLDFS